MTMEIEYIIKRMLTCNPLKAKIIKVNSPTMFWMQSMKTSGINKRTHLTIIRRMRFLPLLLDHRHIDEVAIKGQKWQRGILTQI